ncbi:beta-N-acetylhexosaminidase [Namhaeicola litoreus]|uniref:beta-N-acetylhexosaminidase n=1 Tax=Namhaeicola litoreus TaxID=1052145 RepID=A0ABW3Y0R5_9FLAO
MKIKLLFLGLFAVVQLNQAQNNIIPKPVNYTSTEGSLLLDKPLFFELPKNGQVEKTIDEFKAFLSKANIPFSLSLSNSIPVKVSLNSKKNTEIGDEGYVLELNKTSVEIGANTAAGVWNAFQSLKQLIPTSSEDKVIQTCRIVDYPRFKWRGLMLDVSRHFFSVEDVKQFIDQMAEYKFNVLHWHLTDDQGWRIEIKSLPKLTEVGAWRVERSGRFGEEREAPKPGEKTSYGGYYTQEQIKEVIKYATDRNISIVPEIDVPGHSMAALAAYPELSTKKEPKYVSPGNKFANWFGDGTFEMIVENTLNPADEKVYEFLDKVFTEVAALFPGEYIHMGGDECYHGYWERDENVQQFMKKNKIKDSHELQSYFVKRVEKIISSKGKKMIGWDEILEGGLADGAAVMSWRGMKGGIEAAKMGHEVVMSPTTYAYLDYSQGDHSVENPIYADLSLEKTYSFEPIPDGVDPKFILGGQGNLWTEVIPNMQFAFYMTYPRAFAISESVWSKKSDKNYDDFVLRTQHHFERFDVMGRNISKAVYDPEVKVSLKGDKLICTLSNSIPNSEIYYTIDNTYPVGFGKKYIGEFEIPQGNLSLRTQTYLKGEPVGRELIISRSELEKRAKK